MVLYDYDSNGIFFEATKDKTSTDVVRACDEPHARLRRAGIVPVIQRLDNEVSKMMTQYPPGQDEKASK